MMGRVELVLPNLASFRSRGKLGERCALAGRLGCQVVEVPADLVKSAREVRRTGQDIGEVLTPENIRVVYGATGGDCRYILHTDPAIPRRGEDGSLVVPKLSWSDAAWTARYAASIGETAVVLGGWLEMVEVHPGASVRDIGDLVSGMMVIGDAVEDATGHRPAVCLENKARQKVASASEMLALWELLPHDGRYGLVIDLPNLWRTHRAKWRESFWEMPDGAIRGLHVHWKHRSPGPEDPVVWSQVFERVRDHKGPLFLNPEVFHASQLTAALEVIRRELSLG